MKAPSLNEFLEYYEGMNIIPSCDDFLTLKGIFQFTTKYNGTKIYDSYHLLLKVPYDFPKKLPIVYELDQKIPPFSNYHVNKDKSLCLGSRLRLLYMISKKPSLMGFAENCLEPFLYAISYKEKYNGDLLFGELDHGRPGELEDYVNLMGLKNTDQVKIALSLLSMKKRLANKCLCPCGCQKRLGKCKFNRTIKKFRYLMHRAWFKTFLTTK